MNLINILLILLSLGVIVRLLILFRRGVLAISIVGMWLIIWSGVLFFSLVPDALDWLKNLVMIKHRMNFLFGVTIVALLIMVNHLFEAQKKHSIKIRRLTQELGLLKYYFNNGGNAFNNEQSEE